MTRSQRVLLGLALALPAAVIGIAIRQAMRPPALSVYWRVPEFTLLDQDSIAVRDADLRGQIWLASFVYTHCPDVCPLVTRRMAVLRDTLAARGRLGDVRLVSITVDPQRDTPGVLAQYARAYAARKPEWVFLTGNSESVIPLITQGFRLTLMHPGRHDEHEEQHQHDLAAGTDYMVSHTDRIVLVDREGNVRGTYASSDAEAVARLQKDLFSIAGSRGSRP